MKMPKKYVNKPNLWRVACELSKFRDPRKATDTLVTLAGSALKEDQHEQ